MSFHLPTYDELKHFIEQHDFYTDFICKGRKHGGEIAVLFECDNAVEVYMEYFNGLDIEYVKLANSEHAFMAVKTADRGIMVFDPTIGQHDPAYLGRYFLGSAEELVEHFTKMGGAMELDAGVLDYGSPTMPSPRSYEAKPRWLEQAIYGQHIVENDDYSGEKSSPPDVHGILTARMAYMNPHIYGLCSPHPRDSHQHKEYLRPWEDALAPLEPHTNRGKGAARQ